MNKKILIALALISLITFSAIAYSFITSERQTFTVLEEPETMADIKMWSNVYVTLKDSEGNVKYYHENHNVFTDAGKDATKAILGIGTAFNNFTWIAVGNGTVPASSSTTLNLEIASAGLTRALGTYSSTGTGAWRIEKVFSVTGTVNSINSTALFNQSATGTMLAGDTFTNTNVASGDSLNISWVLSVA